MEDVRILIGLLDDVNVDTSASRPRRIELNASIWSLTSQFGSPSQSTVDLRNELASHPELASELAKGLFQLASESVPHTPDTGTSSTKKLDATQEQIESSTFALRLARNVAAGHAELQHIFWQHVESIDPLLSFVTAFVQVHDEIYRPLTRAAVQMLSNLLMANAEVQHAFWTRYVLDGSRELGRTQLLLRLLASSDHGTLVASLLVLLTCCRGSTQNSIHLVTVPECRALLELLFSVLEQSFRDYAEAEREPSSNPIEELDELSSMTAAVRVDIANHLTFIISTTRTGSEFCRFESGHRCPADIAGSLRCIPQRRSRRLRCKQLIVNTSPGSVRGRLGPDPLLHPAGHPSAPRDGPASSSFERIGWSGLTASQLRRQNTHRRPAGHRTHYPVHQRMDSHID